MRLIKKLIRFIIPSSAIKFLLESKNSCYHFINQMLGFKGVNIGSGKWYKFGWASLDSRHFPSLDAVLTETSKFPFKDGSIKYVYSSHFFEHIRDEVAENILKESYRILENGGVCRISVPNLEQALEKYHYKDHFYFDEILGSQPRYENWLKAGLEVSIESKLLYQFASYDNMDDQGLFPAWHTIPEYYCGPPILKSEEIKKAIESKNIHEFSRWAVSHVPKDRVDVACGHVNVYTLEKFEQLFAKVGFTTYYRSTYRGSKFEELRDEAFDNRPEQSLYFEAVK